MDRGEVSREALSNTGLTEPKQPNALMVCKWHQAPAFMLPALLVEGTAFLEHDILDVLWVPHMPKEQDATKYRTASNQKNRNLSWTVQ